MSWEGPHRIGDYLGSVAHSPWKRPPEKAGVYIVAEKPWRDLPSKADGILYVGQATYLRYQIGRLLCDLLGFTGDSTSADEANQHKGGHWLWSHYCLPSRIEPAALHLGWCSECMCLACAETKLLEMISTGPHRLRVCAIHRPVLDFRQNSSSLMTATRNSDARHR
jgi:hypothetical protein